MQSEIRRIEPRPADRRKPHDRGAGFRRAWKLVLASQALAAAGNRARLNRALLPSTQTAEIFDGPATFRDIPIPAAFRRLNMRSASPNLGLDDAPHENQTRSCGGRHIIGLSANPGAMRARFRRWRENGSSAQKYGTQTGPDTTFEFRDRPGGR